MSPEQILEQLKQDLGQPESEIALLLDSDRAYYSSVPADSISPLSAVFHLVSGIYSHHPERARTLVRKRIFHTRELTFAEKALVKVAAKRASLLGQSHGQPEESFREKIHVSSPLIELEPVATPLRSDSVTPAEALFMCEAAIQNRDEHAVAAALLDRDGRLLAIETNTQGPDRTQHAEMRLVLRHWQTHGRKIPAGATVISTLKPCRMCAAMIAQFCEEFASLKVYYRDFDPGPHGRSTILDPDSPDRRRGLPKALWKLDVQSSFPSAL